MATGKLDHLVASIDQLEKQPSKNDEAYESHINSQALYKLNEFDIYLLINVSLQYDYMILQLCICVFYIEYTPFTPSQVSQPSQPA